jgi:hypothetical protein
VGRIVGKTVVSRRRYIEFILGALQGPQNLLKGGSTSWYRMAKLQKRGSWLAMNSNAFFADAVPRWWGHSCQWTVRRGVEGWGTARGQIQHLQNNLSWNSSCMAARVAGTALGLLGILLALIHAVYSMHGQTTHSIKLALVQAHQLGHIQLR